MKHLESLSGLMHEERVRKRAYSSLDITTSEPNLITDRSSTPDFTLNSRMAVTPDYRRKAKEGESGPANVRVPLASGVTGGKLAQASVGVSTVTAKAGESGRDGEKLLPTSAASQDVRQAVTDCLTRALGNATEKDDSILPPPPPDGDHRHIPTITVSVSYGSLVPPINDHAHSAKQLVTLALTKACEQYEAEVGTSNHSNALAGNHGDRGNATTVSVPS